MLKQIGAVGAASTIAVLATVAPATAMTDVHGAYSQTTGPLSCSESNGVGTLYVEVRGQETRPSDKHFRTDSLRTRIIAQEKTSNGVWLRSARSGPVSGDLGPVTSNDAGTVNYAHFQWGGDTSPVLSISVNAGDDLFRAKVVTRVFDDEGVRVAKLITYQGQCRL